MHPTLALVKKVLAVFLMAVLLTQSVWAAVGGICAHQQTSMQGAANGSAVQHDPHFGHHNHSPSDRQRSIDSDVDTSATPPLGHNDCGACHLVHSPAVATEAAGFAVAPATSAVFNSPTAPKAAWLPSGIERPNWRA
jgi:hypothetical protein